MQITTTPKGDEPTNREIMDRLMSFQSSHENLEKKQEIFQRTQENFQRTQEIFQKNQESFQKTQDELTVTVRDIANTLQGVMEFLAGFREEFVVFRDDMIGFKNKSINFQIRTEERLDGLESDVKSIKKQNHQMLLNADHFLVRWDRHESEIVALRDADRRLEQRVEKLEHSTMV